VHGRRAVALLVALGAGAVARPAAAYHDEHELVTDTAYTLGATRQRVSLWRYDAGGFDWLDVGTCTLLWLVPAPNAQTKLRVWHSGRWAFALRTGVTYVNLDWTPWGSHQSDATIWIVPFEIWFSAPLVKRWGVSVGSISTALRLTGRYDPSEFEGAGAADNQQFALSIEWETTRVVKAVLTARWLVEERYRGDATVVRHPDEFTTVEITGAAETQAESVRNAGYVMLSGVLSWETFNVRAGVGAGNYNLPAVNLMLPKRGLLGELDVYWEW
jgi:hypothetical protein